MDTFNEKFKLRRIDETKKEVFNAIRRTVNQMYGVKVSDEDIMQVIIAQGSTIDLAKEEVKRIKIPNLLTLSVSTYLVDRYKKKQEFKAEGFSEQDARVKARIYMDKEMENMYSAIMSSDDYGKAIKDEYRGRYNKFIYNSNRQKKVKSISLNTL